VNCDYNVLLSWAFYYFFASLTTQLPWSHCDNDWNTPDCTAGFVTGANSSEKLNSSGTEIFTYDTNVTSLRTAISYNDTSDILSGRRNLSYVSDPVTEFWEYVYQYLKSVVKYLPHPTSTHKQRN
jgi:hypothetical protein